MYPGLTLLVQLANFAILRILYLLNELCLKRTVSKKIIKLCLLFILILQLYITNQKHHKQCMSNIRMIHFYQYIFGDVISSIGPNISDFNKHNQLSFFQYGSKVIFYPVFKLTKCLKHQLRLLFNDNVFVLKNIAVSLIFVISNAHDFTTLHSALFFK